MPSARCCSSVGGVCLHGRFLEGHGGTLATWTSSPLRPHHHASCTDGTSLSKYLGGSENPQGALEVTPRHRHLFPLVRAFGERTVCVLGFLSLIASGTSYMAFSSPQPSSLDVWLCLKPFAYVSPALFGPERRTCVSAGADRGHRRRRSHAAPRIAGLEPGAGTRIVVKHHGRKRQLQQDIVISRSTRPHLRSSHQIRSVPRSILQTRYMARTASVCLAAAGRRPAAERENQDCQQCAPNRAYDAWISRSRLQDSPGFPSPLVQEGPNATPTTVVSLHCFRSWISVLCAIQHRMNAMHVGDEPSRRYSGGLGYFQEHYPRVLSGQKLQGSCTSPTGFHRAKSFNRIDPNMSSWPSVSVMLHSFPGGNIRR